MIQSKITLKSIVLARVSFYRSYRKLKLVPEKKAAAHTSADVTSGSGPHAEPEEVKNDKESTQKDFKQDFCD